MNFKEMLTFAYGMLMGTSMPYLKPSKRFLFPTGFHTIDDSLSLMMGGAGVCGILVSADEALVINANRGAAAETLRSRVREVAKGRRLTLVLNSLAGDFSDGAVLFPEAEKIYVGRATPNEIQERFGALADRVEVVNEDRRISRAGETILLMPRGPAATKSDLPVYLEKHATLFLGSLYYNRIQPVISPGIGLDSRNWVETLTTIVNRLSARIIVPGEGDLASSEDVALFVAYLKDMTDAAVEFSHCRRNYDWMEIPRHTSLEENFDILRDQKKNHTTLTS